MTVSVKAPTSTTGSIQLNGSDVLTIDSSGNLTVPNNLTSTGGIYLGGTAAANLLDDYEEGTFTPSLTPASGSITTYSNQLGYYTKVGNRVFCTMRISITNIGTASGDMTLNGLPFANGQSYRVAGYGREDGFLGVQLQWWIHGSSTTGIIRQYNDSIVGWNNSMNLLLVANYFTS
jgi:hypothetical protein